MYKSSLIIILFILSLCTDSIGQSQVAITIDDVPNVKKFWRDGFKTKLLDKLDILNIPVTIFINEGMIYKTKSIAENFNLLNQWVKKDYTTLGNHTFAHSRYSDAGYENFTKDILKGEVITKEISNLYQKPLKYFRFPYNDLGKDSLQKHEIEIFLDSNRYTIAPFTIESSDWIYNYLYEYYLANNNFQEAERIASSYIDVTLKYFQFFDSVSVKQYGRHISQIYLCHDNTINADYLDVLVKLLKDKGYGFVSLDEVMQDVAYEQTNVYNKKWGVSWFYRWMNNSKEMKSLMNNEPDIKEIYNEYKTLSNKNGENN